MKYLKKFDMVNESQESDLAKNYKPINSVLIGSNDSYWAWNDDSDYVYAFLFMYPNTGNLVLKIVQSHVKHGIGAGTVTKEVKSVNVGNIGSNNEKPNFKLILQTLKKHGHDRTSAGRPFPMKGWTILDTDEKMSIYELLKDKRVLRIAKVADILSDDTTRTEESPDQTSVEPPKRKSIRTSNLAFLHKQLSKLTDTEIEELVKKLS